MFPSIYQPVRFFDPAQIPQNVAWMAIGWSIEYGFKKLLKFHPIKINKHQIWRNFQWFRIFCNAINFIFCMYIGNFLKFIGLGIIGKQLDKIMFFNFTHGFSVFKKLEPDMADYILNKLKEFMNKNKK